MQMKPVHGSPQSTDFENDIYNLVWWLWGELAMEKVLNVRIRQIHQHFAVPVGAINFSEK